MELENLTTEIFTLLPVDPFVKILSLDVEPSVVFKLCEAEEIVRYRLQCNARPSSNNRRLQASNVDYHLAYLSIGATLDITWEKLNTGHWSLVSLCDRQLYTAASFIKVLAILERKVNPEPSNVSNVHPVQKKDNVENHTEKCDKIEEALKTTDMGLLLGAPLPTPHGGLLQKAAKILSRALAEKYACDSMASEASHEDVPISCLKRKVIGGVKGKELTRLQRPSLEKFKVEHFDLQYPVILTDCIGHWPAMTRWPDITYLRRVAGARLVPVELGSRYTDEEWSQKLMTLTEFIETYIDKRTTAGSENVGYLAQHPLFDQVPELLSDIREPEYCCISDEDSAEEDTDINAWFGPEGTVSPLHYDPKHNILAQVVGSKRILLYSPDDSIHVFPHQDKLLSNTAQVDPESPDYDKFPGYREATAWECQLNSGEMLYIPPRWWHHVRSLETSFSVSFWWK